MLNEHVTGGRRPGKSRRQERLKECVAVVRDLWAEETVTHDGLVTVKDTSLYTRPS